MLVKHKGDKIYTSIHAKLKKNLLYKAVRILFVKISFTTEPSKFFIIIRPSYSNNSTKKITQPLEVRWGGISCFFM